MSRPKPLTYWQEALAELQALLRKPIASSGQGHEIYSQLVIILKEYLAKRYGGSAYAMTDEELFVFLAGTSCPTEMMQLIEQILRGGTEIRFAGQHTYRETVAEAINNGIIVIKNTLPQEGIRE